MTTQGLVHPPHSPMSLKTTRNTSDSRRLTESVLMAVSELKLPSFMTVLLRGYQTLSPDPLTVLNCSLRPVFGRVALTELEVKGVIPIVI